MLKAPLRPSRRFLVIFASLMVPLFIEVFLYWRTFDIPRPQRDLDPPFQVGCREPDVGAKRENAAMVMLAQNSELEAVRHTINSIEDKFNRWFHYPYVFLNDKPWDPEFIRVINQTVSGEARFEVIPTEEWTYPSWTDQDAAKQSIFKQGQQGIHYGGREGYHHMCRFFSGKFYTLEALRQYKWYWRLEPDVDFACSITYDPFAEMAKRNQVYGWTISLWEEPNTCPSLFRAVSDWKETHRIPTNDLWTAMLQASWLPYPFRRWLSWLPQHDRWGDVWSLCHYWSNFEIADLDFFRGSQYQDLFEYLDRKGGFYDERWGDAAVHSLAVGMLVGPERVHHFSDFAYRHNSFQQCPANAPGLQLVNSSAVTTSPASASTTSVSQFDNALFTKERSEEAQGLGETLGPGVSTSVALGDALFAPEQDGGVGCRCTCKANARHINYPGYCTNKLKQPTRPERYWFTWFL